MALSVLSQGIAFVPGSAVPVQPSTRVAAASNIVAEEVRLGSLHYRVAWQGATPDSWIRADDDAWTDGSTTDVLQVWQAAKAAAAAKKKKKQE